MPRKHVSLPVPFLRILRQTNVLQDTGSIPTGVVVEVSVHVTYSSLIGLSMPAYVLCVIWNFLWLESEGVVSGAQGERRVMNAQRSLYKIAVSGTDFALQRTHKAHSQFLWKFKAFRCALQCGKYGSIKNFGRTCTLYGVTIEWLLKVLLWRKYQFTEVVRCSWVCLFQTKRSCQ